MKLNPLHSSISVLILLTVPCKLNGTGKVNLFNGAPPIGSHFVSLYDLETISC